MRRSASRLLLGLAVALLLVACQRQPAPAAEPPATLSVDEAATAVAATVEAITGLAPDEMAQAVTAQPTAAPTEAAAAAAEESTGRVIFSVPFQARPDGFGFRNYGRGYPEGDLTIADLRAQFGDGVCSRIEDGGDRCVPTAEAQQWLADRNSDMLNGHCIGFTVTSYRFAEGELQVDDYSPTAGTPFDIAQQPPIMRTIAANGSLYWAKSVWSNEVDGTPREVLDALIALAEPVDLSIYLPGLVGGHSLLAYGVEEVAPQQYRILVYDNNFPGQNAYVEVDYAANTWNYDQGAMNPGETAVPYSGDATTNTLRFIPLSAYESVSCPFCPPPQDVPAPSADDAAVTLLSFLGQGDVLVKTALGEIGVVAGQIINDLPGARLIFPRAQLAATGTPSIVLPGDLDFTVEFNQMQRISSLNPTASVVLDQMTPATEQSSLEVAMTEQTVAFQTGAEQSPILKTTVRQDDATVSAAVMGVDYAAGQGIAMSAAAQNGTLAIHSTDADLSDGTLLIARQTSQDEAIFATTALNVPANGSVALDVAGWDGESSMDVYSDADGDGDLDEEPEPLINEPLTDVIQQSDPAVVSSVMDNLSPLLGEQSLTAILIGLGDKDLSGQEIGDILRPMNLTTTQLVDLIQGYDLPLPEMAELIFALRLDDESLEALIEGLDLTAEDETELRAALANLVLYQEIITEWHFLNTEDVTRLAPVLTEAELTAEQLVELFPRLELTNAEIELVLGNMSLSPEDLDLIVAELELSKEAIAAVTPVARAASPTPSPTPTGTGTATPTATPTTTPSGTPPTATPTAAGTVTSTPTPTPDGGVLPPATPTPPTYPYPGALPTPTTTPAPYPYPGPVASPTPDYESEASCEGDDLHIVAQEPTWLDANIEIWMGETKLLEDKTGPEGEAYETIFTGPSIWKDLAIVSDKAPLRVPLGSFVCPKPGPDE